MAFKNFLELEKKTSSGHYLDNLTGIRALAVIWVLVFHTWAVSGGGKIVFSIPFSDHIIGMTRIVRMGEWGVDIFFVLSGFLLTIPLLKIRNGGIFWITTLQFYRRRALRIIPAYYFTLLALIFLLLFGLGQLPTPAQMLQHTLFINQWLGTPPLRGAFWSLPAEVFFYLVLPFCIYLGLRKGHFYQTFLIAAALTILFRFIIINTTTIEAKGIYLFSFIGRMDQFSFGAICAYLSIHRPISARKGNLLLLIGLIGIILFASFISRRGNMFENRDYYYYFFQTIVGFFAALIIYGTTSRSIIAHRIFGNKFMIFIGTISYSIYLWHTIILDIYTMTNLPQGLTSDNKLIATILYTWPPILIISFFSYLFIERPFLKVRHEVQYQPTSLIAKHPIYFLGASALALVALTALAQATYHINH